MTDRELVKQIIRLFNSDDEGGLRGDIIYRRPYTYVQVLYPSTPHGTVYGYGFSKVCWPDQWDQERGYEIALAKAARDVVAQLSSVEAETKVVYDDIPF